MAGRPGTGASRASRTATGECGLRRLVLVCESAEDLFSADPVLGEVDLRWPGVGLSGCELAEGTVRPGCVVVPQVFGQYPAQMVLIDDQQPVEELPAQGTDDPRRWRSLWAPAVGWRES